jgi:N-acetyl-gamma-glutamyl-phosphate reductase
MVAGLIAHLLRTPTAGGAPTVEQLYEAAHAFYRDEPFVKVTPADKGRSAHTRSAKGTNLAYVSYAVNPRTGLIVAVGAVDNLGKGASGQAVQNANLMTGQPESAGLGGLPVWPDQRRPSAMPDTQRSNPRASRTR